MHNLPSVLQRPQSTVPLHEAPRPLTTALNRRALLRRAALAGSVLYVAPAILDSFTPGTAFALSGPPPAHIAANTNYHLTANTSDGMFLDVVFLALVEDTATGTYSGQSIDMPPVVLSGGTLSGQTFTFTLSGAASAGASSFDGTYTGTATTASGSNFSGSFLGSDGSTTGDFTLAVSP